MKKIAILVLFVFLAGGIISAENQGWINNSLTMKISPKLSLKLTNEIRCAEITYADPFLKNWQGGLSFDIGKGFQLGFHYKRETTDKSSYYLKENRYTIEAGWKKDLSKKLKFDILARAEIREYDQDLSRDNVRFRLRFRLTGKASIGNLALKPFIASEPFADTKDEKINAHRFYLGTAIQLSPKIDLVINYIRLDASGKDPIHILNSGVEIKL
jgi:hypothetical protein